MDNSKKFEFHIPSGKSRSFRIASAKANELFEFDIVTQQQQGRFDDIGVSILDHDNFIVWETRRKALEAGASASRLPSYRSIASVKIAWGVLHFESEIPGDYYVVLDNSHSVITGKQVKVVATRLPSADYPAEPSNMEFKPVASLDALELNLRRFPLMIRQLQHRHGGRPPFEIRDEYDLQDLLHSVLTLSFSDIRTEEWTPSYAGGTSRMDFLLKAEQIVIETKRTREGLGPKEVGDQLLVDMARYQEHADCKSLICLVYDPEGRISNSYGLENDLRRSGDGMQVSVIVTPKGT